MVEQSEALGSIGAIDSSPTYDSAPSTPTQQPVSIAQQAARQPQPQPSAQEIQSSLAQVNERLATVGRVMTLNVDAGSGLTVATIRDSQTGEVLEQFPSTDSIHLAQMLAGWASGKNILLDLIA
jgi:uncharacterized FlaG/YvyC family protein